HMTITDNARLCHRCGSAQTNVVDQVSSLPLSYAQCETCGYVTGFARRPQSYALSGLLASLSPRLRSALVGAMWMALSAWVVWADYLAAFEIPFPVTYILPVLFAANNGYRVLALALSIALPLTRLEFDRLGVWATAQNSLANCVIQIFVLASIAVLVYRQR